MVKNCPWTFFLILCIDEMDSFSIKTDGRYSKVSPFFLILVLGSRRFMWIVWYMKKHSFYVINFVFLIRFFVRSCFNFYNPNCSFRWFFECFFVIFKWFHSSDSRSLSLEIPEKCLKDSSHLTIILNQLLVILRL